MDFVKRKKGSGLFGWICDRIGVLDFITELTQP